MNKMDDPKVKSAKYYETLGNESVSIVMCQGICTSQIDDYCGMHTREEECPACKSVWETAHRENRERKEAEA